ncbi:MAG: FecR domain-containing protein [Pseudomonadota bacterium]|nr:FecR domain-containing protein [Pseudomonadota bacterium]
MTFALPAVAGLLLIQAVAGTETTVGTVKRVRPQVDASRASEVLALAAAAVLHQNDVLRSGKKARLEAEFLDGTSLMLGENAELKLDTYVYDPTNALRNRLMATIRGAFLFIGGKTKNTAIKVTIAAPDAVVEGQGTTVWAGPIDDAYGVLAVAGMVSVTTKGGSATLSAGEGTTITSAEDPPSKPKVWPTGKRNRALTTVAFE